MLTPQGLPVSSRVRPGTTRFRRIVVALGDGSYADQLEAAAISLAAGADAEVVFVNVDECSACCGPPDHPALHEHERDLPRLLVRRLLAQGIHARSEQWVTVTRRVSRHILDAVEKSRGDLLIIAAGQSGHFRSLLHRRLIAGLLRDAPCAVFVVPLPPEARSRTAVSAWLWFKLRRFTSQPDRVDTPG